MNYVCAQRVAIGHNADVSEAHRCFEAHFERPERISSLLQRLRDSEHWQHCQLLAENENAQRSDLARCHGAEHMRWLDTIEASSGAIDEQLAALRQVLRHPDVYVTRRTAQAAFTAAGTVIKLLDALLAGRFRRAFAVIRPPGHHAGCKGPSGFCFVNNVMCAALRAVDAGERVAIVDIDVHFGDGTADLMLQHAVNNRRLAYMSIHRYDDGAFYPNDARALGGDDTKPLGRRFVAVPFNGTIDDEGYERLWRQRLLPALADFAPSLLLVSAGYDACQGDPLGGCSLTSSLYKRLFASMLDVCPRLLAVLEGGYNLQSTSDAALHSIAAMIGHA